MPHVIIEYSGNVGEWGDQVTITKAVHDGLCSLGHLPTDAIKTRAVHHDHFHIGGDTEGEKASSPS